MWTILRKAIVHSENKFKEKNILMILSNGERFIKDRKFTQLNPVYDVSPKDIQDFIIRLTEPKHNI